MFIGQKKNFKNARKTQELREIFRKKYQKFGRTRRGGRN